MKNKKVHEIVKRIKVYGKAIEWKRPDVKEFVKAARAAEGAAGPDGWTGAEVAALPLEVLEIAFRMLKGWEEEGKVPKPIRQARQVNLTKPAKINKGKLAAENTRPISVLSTWWRAWGTMWVKSDAIERWRKANIPEEVVGGSGGKSGKKPQQT